MAAVVACGDAHTGSITRRGELFCWGVGTSGEVAQGSRQNSNVRPNPALLCFGS